MELFYDNINLASDQNGENCHQRDIIGYFSLIYYLFNEFLQGRGEVTACFLQTYMKALWKSLSKLSLL